MWFLTVTCVMVLAGNHPSSGCPLAINPPNAAVRFGDPLWANCTASTQQVQGMGWESSQGGSPLTGGVRAVPLDIPSVTDWGLSPFCYINTLDGNQCKETLQVIVYKMPDKVLISGHGNPLVQDRNYEMRCEVLNVAPLKNLFLHWYKGNTLINTSVFNDPAAHPVNASAAITLLADGGDHGRSIWCEAVMYFYWHGADRPASRSQEYRMEVLFPPTFPDGTEAELELPDGGPLLLNCTARGNPAPAYSWRFPEPVQLTSGNEATREPVLKPVLQLPGVYTCTAWNSQGSTTKTFTVVEPERDRTTFAAIVGGFVAAGVLLVLAGLYFVTPDGSFAFNKGGYQGGRPASSGPV